MKRFRLPFVAVCLVVVILAAFGFAPPEVAVRAVQNCFGNRIKNVGTPTEAADAATKSYVDARNAWTSSSPETLYPGGSITVVHGADASNQRTTGMLAAVASADSIGGLWDFDSNTVDKSWYGMSVTLSGNAQLSAAQTKFGAKSLLLDGTGDYVTANASMASATLGVSDFTVDLWFRTSSLANMQALIDWRPYNVNGAYPVIYIAATTGALKYQTSSVDRISGGTVTTNTWHHMAAVRRLGTTTLYLNGASVGTWTDATVYLEPPTLRIGANYTGAVGFNGYIDEVRIEPGYARWTANFADSLPSAAHTPSYLIGEVRAYTAKFEGDAVTTFRMDSLIRAYHQCVCRVGHL